MTSDELIRNPRNVARMESVTTRRERGAHGVCNNTARTWRAWSLQQHSTNVARMESATTWRERGVHGIRNNTSRTWRAWNPYRKILHEFYAEMGRATALLLSLRKRISDCIWKQTRQSGSGGLKDSNFLLSTRTES